MIAGGEEVGAVIDLVASDLLGAHVADLAFEGADFGFGSLGGRFGDPKVADLDLSGEGEQDI